MTVVEPEDLFAMRPLAQPVSDGQRVYYLETRLDQSANARQTMIASVRLSAGEDRRRWSPMGVDVHQLTLSPNGQQLAFSGVIHDHAQLFVMATTGGAAVQVTHGDADVHHLLWSADGRNVYFQVDRIPQDSPATPASGRPGDRPSAVSAKWSGNLAPTRDSSGDSVPVGYGGPDGGA